MIFHSLDFILFFVVVTLVYWRLSQRAQNVLLLVASYFFYGYIHPWFLTLIAASTVIDYASARAMEQWPHRKRAFMAVSIISNFGMLGFFKYFNFFADNVHAVLSAAGFEVGMPVLRVLLPVGISFYTFQAMSYTVDVYRGELRARRSLLDVAVFISFFPHLVAGPIQRASFLLPQVERARRFSIEQAASGFYLMVWGFFKKLVIADNVGVIANKVFALSDPSFEMLWAGVFAFAIQIYADFSAYTDIARGSSRWLGFELTQNFDHPYLARNPADFWRRWNISLSSWFRDYVYIPLGGSQGRRGDVGAQRADHVPAVRPVARRQLELRAVGAVPRRPPRPHAGARNPAPGLTRGEGRGARGDHPGPPDRGHVCADADWLVAVPGDGAERDRPGPQTIAVRQHAARAAGWSLPVPAGFWLFHSAVGAEHLGRAGPPRAGPAGRVGHRRPSRRRLRRRLRRDPRPSQPHLAGLHLLSVLAISYQLLAPSDTLPDSERSQPLALCPTASKASALLSAPSHFTGAVAQSHPSSPFAFTAFTRTTVPGVAPGSTAFGCVTRSVRCAGLAAVPHVTR